jgi:D-galacturonate reductase
VTASASSGVADKTLGRTCEDTITLMVQWENLELEGGELSGHIGTAVYTASWIAPQSDVHSQQRFFYMGQQGEISVDQAHRGYCMSTDRDGYGSVNPLFMKYTPCNGDFVGQLGYGYRSLEAFIDAVRNVNAGNQMQVR